MDFAVANGSCNNYTISEDIIGPLFSAVICIVLILTILANSVIVLHTVTHVEAIKKASAILFFNLALGNIMVTVFFMPFTIITAALGRWIFGDVKSGLCQFVGLAFNSYMFILINTLAAISFDRWLFIIKPVVYKRIMKTFVAWLIVVAIWGIAIIVSLTPFIGLGKIGFAPYVASCFPQWEDRNYVIYTVLMVQPGFTIITITSIWTFAYTRWFIKHHYSAHGTSSIERNSEENKVYNVKMRRIFGLFGVLLISNMILFAPQNILGLVIVIIGINEIPSAVSCTALVMFLLNGVANPAVQALFRRDLRDSFLKVKKKLKCQTKELKSRSTTTHTTKSSI